jgi:hypothetical protein
MWVRILACFRKPLGTYEEICGKLSTPAAFENLSLWVLLNFRNSYDGLHQQLSKPFKPIRIELKNTAGF